MRMDVFAIMLICMLFAGISGCIEDDSSDEFLPQTPSSVTPSPMDFKPMPEFEIGLIKGPVKLIRTDGSCYWEADIAAKNVGEVDAQNVVIHVKFIDTADGSLQTENQYYPRFNIGERKIFTLRFDGICDHSYRMEFEVDADRPS